MEEIAKESISMLTDVLKTIKLNERAIRRFDKKFTALDFIQS